jgi:hypothetical protein
VYEYFHELDGYEFLPFKHVQVYVDDDVSDSLIWVCPRYCNFWCEIIDPLIMDMERHLCVDCMVIPHETRNYFRQLLYKRMCVYIKQLFNIDIEILSDADAVHLMRLLLNIDYILPYYYYYY